MQQQLERKQHSLKPRWRLSIGEWLILLLNLTIIGMSAWVLGNIFAASHPDDGRPPKYDAVIYPAGGGAVLTLGSAALTSLVLLLRQPRIAALFQWVAAMGACLIVIGALLEWQQYAQHLSWILFAPVPICLLLTLLLIVSGRFLRMVDDET